MDYLVDNNTVAIGSGDTAPLTGTAGEATAGNPASTPPVPATRWPAWAWNMILGSCRLVIIAAGLTPNRQDRTLLAQGVGTIGHRQLVYATPGTYTWTVPSGVYRIFVRVYGGGGGSGGTYASGSASLGGGGGGYAEGYYGVTPGQVLPITVAAGGAAGIASSTPNPGSYGGSSSAGALCSATGGQGGAGANGTTAQNVAAGGVGSGGALNVAGCSSTGTFPLSGGGVVTSQGGAAFGGMTAHFGATSVSAAGIPGQFPGGGAAGSAAQADGAIGAGGLVEIFY